VPAAGRQPHGPTNAGSAGRWPATSHLSSGIAQQPASGRLYRFFFAALNAAAARIC